MHFYSQKNHAILCIKKYYLYFCKEEITEQYPIFQNKMTKKIFHIILLCITASYITAAGKERKSANPATSIRVSHTSLRLDVRDFATHTLWGKATLTIHAKEDGISIIPLQLLCLNIDSVWIGNAPSSDYNYNDSTVIITLPHPMTMADSTDVTIAYHGTPHVETFGGFGFYDAERMAHNMGVSFNDRPHNYGKSWFPCIDDFCSRSTFDGYYQTSLDRKAIGNGLLMSCDTITESIISGAKTDSSLVWHWRLNQPIPDYLCNVAVGDYEKVHCEYSNGNRTIPIDAYVTPDETEGMKEALACISSALAVMERHFGPYVWDRVGYVTVNSPSGAMEHATNISIPRHPSSSAEYTEILIHELIHHWFGDLVTCKTAGDMWLNEGITSYMVELVAEEGDTPLDLKEYQAYLDSWQYSTPVGSAEYHALTDMPEDLTYGDITYLKGGWVMRQLRHELGDELFFKAMKQYTHDFAFRNASCKDFKESIEKSTGRKLTSFFQKYIYK